MPRPSPVTDAVWDVFASHARHAWALDDLHQTVRSQIGGADYSSVFRAVSGLEGKGLIDRLELGDGRAHYELHDDHHEHVRCEQCGQVAEVPGCVLEGVPRAVQSSTGYQVRAHRLVFIGLCPTCAQRSPE
ncbi:MAG TPA: transcriptional repressor [Candidatus Acidoferrales bacterium]|nr:transcriptional repressor [Candidatus Acidoferrales bacterium]